MIDHLLLQLGSLTPQCMIQLKSGLCLTLEESFKQWSTVQLGTHLKPTGEMGVVVGTLLGLGLLALALSTSAPLLLVRIRGACLVRSWLMVSSTLI